jgi:hypothetical protein
MPGQSLYQVALAAKFDMLPAPVQRFHGCSAPTTFHGEAEIDGAETPAGAILARLMGFPRAVSAAPVSLTVIPLAGSGERWIRKFGASTMTSTLSPCRPGVITERMHSLAFDTQLVASPDELTLAITAARAGPIPLPRLLWPHTTARVHDGGDDRYAFDIAIGLPLLGRLVRYRGWLATGEAARAS